MLFTELEMKKRINLSAATQHQMMPWEGRKMEETFRRRKRQALVGNTKQHGRPTGH